MNLQFDLELSGPVFSWRLSRTYRNQTWPGIDIHSGSNWFDGMADMRIKPAGVEHPSDWYTTGDDGSLLSVDYQLRFNARSIVPLTERDYVVGHDQLPGS